MIFTVSFNCEQLPKDQMATEIGTILRSVATRVEQGEVAGNIVVGPNRRNEGNRVTGYIGLFEAR